MSSFESDVMEDLYYDEAEGPARNAFDAYDEDEGDEFLGGIIGGVGRAVGGLLGGGNRFDEYDSFDEFDELDEFEAYDEFEGDSEEYIDAMEDAVVDALAADDSDEFFRRLARGIGRVARGAVSAVRRAAPVVGRIARTVAPIASAIPLPWTQAIGRVANVVGRLAADEADEFDALDEVIDMVDDADIDAAAPVIAGLTVRRAMPNISSMPRAERRRIVHSVTQATRAVTRRQGAQAARAIPGVVRSVQTAVRQRRVAPRTAPRAIARTAARVARSPQMVRQLVARSGVPVRGSRGSIRGPLRRRGIAYGGVCPSCRGTRYSGRGPITITIRGR